MSLYETAVTRFIEWLDVARGHEGILEPTAMTLSTALPDGRPSARTVLLKQVDAQGFVYYTNSLSRKGKQIQANPQAALTFFWEPLMRQVLVEGSVAPVSDAEADAYFASRPRISQIGAWASQQSEPLESRAAFEARVEAIEQKYLDVEVPRPPHWTGFRLTPNMIEFWQGREGRLHDRERYFQTEDDRWEWTLLNP